MRTLGNNYIDFITIAKGFAIICVVLGHFTPVYMPETFQSLKDFVYLFHMPLFMLLAGFLFENSIAKVGDHIRVLTFIKKKFFRLMIPYFFLSFSIAALNGVLQIFMPVKVPVNIAYLYHIFYEDVGGSATFLWFLYTLFIIFILAICSTKIPKGHLVLFIIACILPFVTLTPVFYLNSVGLFLFYFCSGQLFYKLMLRRTFICRKTALVSLVIFGGAYFARSIVSLHVIATMLNYACGISACIIILYVSLGLSSGKILLSKVLRYTGKYSSYIYLLHMMGVYAVRLIYEKIGWYSSFSYAVFLIMAILVGCIIPIVIAKIIIERNRIMLFLIGENKKSDKNLVRTKK